LRHVIVSDLHVGSRQRRDLLRSPAIRDRLLDAIAGADQLVLLGDVLELRDLPVGRVLELARPLLNALGSALRGGRIVLVPGNHDHQLAAPALRAAGPLGLERQAPAATGAAGAVAAALGHADVLISYPGFWIRPDVWATHGHYMDAHTAAATLECLSSSLLQGTRLRRRPACSAEDYERVLDPLYRALYALAQRPRLTHAADASKRLLRLVERRLQAPRGPAAPGLASEIDGARTAGVMALLGGATARAGRSEGELRRPGIGPMREVLRALGVDAPHVVFGHTHRAMQSAAVHGGISHLTSTGSWVVESGGGSLDESHLPGVITVVGSHGPPRIERVLDARHVM
jgi:UDP-2,3-diacylglucosamine pyrophosphatase LpxH